MRRWLIRWHKLHPIRDRALIDAVLPLLYATPGLTLAEAMEAATGAPRPSRRTKAP